MRTRETLLPLDEFILSIPLIVKFQALGGTRSCSCPSRSLKTESNNVPGHGLRNQIFSQTNFAPVSDRLCPGTRDADIYKAWFLIGTGGALRGTLPHK